MASNTWYYARGEQRVGPVTTEQLRALAAGGGLRPDDLVWAEGAPQWVPAGSRPELFGAGAAAAVMPVSADPAGPAYGGGGHHPAAAAVNTVGYYVSTVGMPARATAHLRGHATPVGDTGDWPLDDARVAAFRQTMKLRKKVFAAAQLYQALFALAIIAGVILLLVAVGVGAGAGRGGAAGLAAMAMAIPLVLFAGLTVLYFFAWRATLRSRRWAPITMFVLFMIGVAANVLSMAIALTGSGEPAAFVGGLVGLIFPLLFAGVSWQAVAAIPRYLAQPAWCQELIASAEL